MIQLHVPNPIAAPGTNPATTDILVPTSVLALSAPLDGVASPGALALYPTCESVPRGNSGGSDAAGQGARTSFLRMALDAGTLRDLLASEDELGLGLDLASLEIPRRP